MHRTANNGEDEGAACAKALYCCCLSVCVCSHVVVHVEVLRVGRGGHQQEHLTEFQRIGLSLDFEVSRHEDEDARSRLRAIHALDRVSDRFEGQRHELADDRLGTAETGTLEGQQGHGLLRTGKRGEGEQERVDVSTGLAQRGFARACGLIVAAAPLRVSRLRCVFLCVVCV